MQDIIITLLQKMFILTLQMAVPILLVGVVLGLMVSIFQTVTQIQESTLTFVPKSERGMFMQQLSKFPKIIKTPRLVLRVVEPTKENAEKIFSIVEQNRDYLMDWQGHFGELKTADNVKAYLTKRANQIKTDSGVCFYIFYNDNIVGRVRFFDIRENVCEIGYWLIKSANGNGFMSEALHALEVELFKFGFKKITLDIDDGNVHSENVAKRNGYKFEKRLPMASWAKCVGKCDSLIYVKER